jgi:hypothetical protein
MAGTGSSARPSFKPLIGSWICPYSQQVKVRFAVAVAPKPRTKLPILRKSALAVNSLELFSG